MNFFCFVSTFERKSYVDTCEKRESSTIHLNRRRVVVSWVYAYTVWLYRRTKHATKIDTTMSVLFVSLISFFPLQNDHAEVSHNFMAYRCRNSNGPDLWCRRHSIFLTTHIISCDTIVYIIVNWHKWNSDKEKKVFLHSIKVNNVVAMLWYIFESHQKGEKSSTLIINYNMQSLKLKK